MGMSVGLYLESSRVKLAEKSEPGIHFEIYHNSRSSTIMIIERCMGIMKTSVVGDSVDHIPEGFRSVRNGNILTFHIKERV